MNKLILLALLSTLPAHAGDAPSLVGKWTFYKKVFDGQEMPESPQASLRLHFDFSASGDSSLYWWHEGDTDHCAQKGRYHVEGQTLVDEITWVDPANTVDCSSDPDMQQGRTTRTPFYFRGDDLAIRFQINGDPLDMVWKRTEAEGK